MLATFRQLRVVRAVHTTVKACPALASGSQIHSCRKQALPYVAPSPIRCLRAPPLRWVKQTRGCSSVGSAAHPEASILTAAEASSAACLTPGLYLVGTPIGNLEDLSVRALKILQNATIVLAEDTRHSRKLLNHYGIKSHMYSFHQHNEHSKQAKVGGP